MTKEAAIAEAQKVAANDGLDMVVFDDRVNDEFLTDEEPYGYAPTGAWIKLWSRWSPAYARVTPSGEVIQLNGITSKDEAAIRQLIIAVLSPAAA